MKEIKGYENYKITEDGQVWSSNINRYLKPSKDKDGYYKVTLSKNSEQKQFFVHRLVAETYLENPDNKKTVDHIDGDIHNNHYTNLQWATYSEQNENPHWKKKKTKLIVCIETNEIYMGITEAHKKLGLNMGHLSECCNGKRNSCGDYHWRYATKEEIEQYYITNVR